MIKKIVALLLCTAFIIGSSNILVKADASYSFSMNGYSGYGSVSISEYSASATTFVNPLAHVTVSATYTYVVNRNSLPIKTQDSCGSDGGDGSASVSFSVSYPSKSSSIYGNHSCALPGGGTITTPMTSAFFS